MVKRSFSQISVLFLLLTVSAFAGLAQSPNTASIIVTVVDQNDALLRGANVTVTNTATGAQRQAVSGDNGAVTLAALSLTGRYRVTVTMAGFTPQEVDGLNLRASETATVKIKLVASGGQNEVTVFGTTEGVRTNPQIGLPLESQRIAETPIIGRKVSTLPRVCSLKRSSR